VEDAMKFLALCNPEDQNPDEGFLNLLPRELNALLRLKSRSTLVEAWTPGGSGAFLIT
jgi:hypothetical protein